MRLDNKGSLTYSREPPLPSVLIDRVVENRIEAAVPAGKLIHAILDNYAVHKHPKVRAWLARHPRWTFHFTPTSCSWANAVEGFFATLTRQRLQRGVFHSLVDLQAAIHRYLGEHNRKSKPFVWTADPDRIIEKVNRRYQVIASDHVVIFRQMIPTALVRCPYYCGEWESQRYHLFEYDH